MQSSILTLFEFFLSYLEIYQIKWYVRYINSLRIYLENFRGYVMHSDDISHIQTMKIKRVQTLTIILNVLHSA